MTIGSNVPSPVLTFTDENGAPYANGSVLTTVPGTLNYVTTYMDYLTTIPNTNPIILNASGQCQIYVPSTTTLIRMILKDTNNALVFDQVTSVPTSIAAIESNSTAFVAALSGTTSSTFANGADSRFANALQIANNLSDLNNTIVARSNLGVSYGTVANTVVQGNDSRFYSTGQQIKTTSYVLQASDAGSTIYFTSNGTLTIPSNATVSFALETLIGIRAANSVTVTISISSDTLLEIPNGATGSRTLSGPGLTYITKAANTLWTISAGGLS